MSEMEVESTASHTASAAVEVPMIDTADFASMMKSMTEEDEMRETLIKRSREVLKSAKNSIYDIHRGNFDRAKEALENGKKIVITDLLPIVAAHPNLRISLSGALEEYAEAVIFLNYVRTGKLSTLAELEIVNREEYLGGLMDSIGELNRYAVLRATARDMEAVKRARDFVDVTHHQLMLFDWRNGNLRRKFDGIKYTLKKLEQITYELTLASMSAFVPKSSEDAPGEGEAGEGPDAGAGVDAGNAADARNDTSQGGRFRHPKRPRSPTR